jgi:hypothetical protein
MAKAATKFKGVRGVLPDEVERRANRGMLIPKRSVESGGVDFQ